MALFTSVGDFLDFFTAMIIGDSLTARLTKGLLLFGSWRNAKEIFFFFFSKKAERRHKAVYQVCSLIGQVYSVCVDHVICALTLSEIGIKYRPTLCWITCDSAA